MKGEGYMRHTMLHIKAGLQPAQRKLKRNSSRGFRNEEEDPLQGAGLVMPRAWIPGPTTLHARRAWVATDAANAWEWCRHWQDQGC